ncbi:hypothetical protein BHM03_00051946 [Ensete ventricosum]|nr:hypothetical protein BHM03_00051946 [Ensete ventricosum]
MERSKAIHFLRTCEQHAHSIYGLLTDSHGVLDSYLIFCPRCDHWTSAAVERDKPIRASSRNTLPLGFLLTKPSRLKVQLQPKLQHEREMEELRRNEIFPVAQFPRRGSTTYSSSSTSVSEGVELGEIGYLCLGLGRTDIACSKARLGFGIQRRGMANPLRERHHEDKQEKKNV